MQLTYRGIRYASAPATIEATEIGISGKYRGVATHISTPTKHFEPSAQFTYRGVTYSHA